ncbi:MAG: phosphoribosylglycinamide formyltransferase [Burkholderiales bacterium]|nr:MAG: phosphoribosylglycinamide formyltransferase [Betaproteobacteria bacterium]TAG23914.1 MAG: phosphoribosylglycinamide formyltransferase [Burkholderiales bacterium]TAG46105.1 MAG: phosphoribosylglycinamide formyltransferase [Betaproteobacteria bacterium]
MRVAVLASGEGRTLQSLIDAIQTGALLAQICLVISNNRDSGALRRARESSIPTAYLSRTTHPDEGDLDAALHDALENSNCTVVVLAGYMRKLGAKVLSRYAGSILNPHPSLLPRHGGQGMYGQRVHEAVLASGDSETGVSVHFVDQGYDTGKVISQAVIAVERGETIESLEQRVRMLERRLLCRTLQELSLNTRATGPNA